MGEKTTRRVGISAGLVGKSELKRATPVFDFLLSACICTSAAASNRAGTKRRAPAFGLHFAADRQAMPRFTRTAGKSTLRPPVVVMSTRSPPIPEMMHRA